MAAPRVSTGSSSPTPKPSSLTSQASCYAASPTGGGGLSTPEEVAAAFLQDYEEVRAEPLSERERRAASAAAAWILAFNTHWQAALIDHGFCSSATIALVQDHQEDYLSLSWR